VSHVSPDSSLRDEGTSTTSTKEPSSGAPEESTRRPFWREIPFLVVAALVIAIVLKTFLLQAFYIPSESMLPTLQRGDRVIVEKVGYRFGGPARGDIVVFERDVAPEENDESVWTKLSDSIKSLFGLPTAGNEDLIKRVIAIEGDTVEGRGADVLVNGEPIDDDYVDGEATYDFPPTVVGSDEVFVMGDNRNASEDSRVFGTVPESRIVGKAVVVVWPLGRIGAI
jgi:signal peptidase I